MVLDRTPYRELRVTPAATSSPSCRDVEEMGIVRAVPQPGGAGNLELSGGRRSWLRRTSVWY